MHLGPSVKFVLKRSWTKIKMVRGFTVQNFD